MPWDPAQYLKFAGHRLRPALDLLNRIDLAAPDHVYDLGAGAGNVTRLLRARWPEARITGVDDSAEMLAKRRRRESGHHAAAGRPRHLAAGATGRSSSTPTPRCTGCPITRSCFLGSSTGWRRAACWQCRSRATSRRHRTPRSARRRAAAVAEQARAAAPSGAGGGARLLLRSRWRRTRSRSTCGRRSTCRRWRARIRSGVGEGHVAPTAARRAHRPGARRLRGRLRPARGARVSTPPRRSDAVPLPETVHDCGARLGRRRSSASQPASQRPLDSSRSAYPAPRPHRAT